MATRAADLIDPAPAPAGSPLEILMIAYACSPRKRGEHLLGWEWASRLAARGHRITVLTRDTHLADSEGLRPATLTMVPVNDRSFRFLRRLGWPGLAAYYQCWQNAAAAEGRRLLAARRFDVVHQVTFHTVRIPGRLAAPGNPPFIWGPVAGLERVPMRMLPSLGLGAVREVARALANAVTPYLPGVRRTLRHAHTILVSNKDTLVRLRAAHPRQYELLPANAVDPDELPRHEAGDGRLELVAVGSMVRIRGFDLVLRAMASLPAPALGKMRLTFVGDGRDLPRLRRLTRRLGLTESVQFAGTLPRSQTLALMSRAHLLVFPSLRDSGGSAVAEAMAMGLPVVALDHAGPGAMLARGGGVLIRPRSRRYIVDELRRILGESTKPRAHLFAEGVRERGDAATLLGWSERIRVIETIYAKASAAMRQSRARVR